jgi:acyl transferase domain-containing protein
MNEYESDSEAAVEPIAVIGMACRVPGAANVDEYWANLRDGVESIRTFTREEALAAGASRRAVDDPQHVFANPILDHVEDFDAALFNCTRREAEILDPQHRVLLECASAALDHAGYDPARFAGDIGVYAGVGSGEYQWYHLLPDKALVSAVGHMAIALANNTDYASTLVSYKLNLRGPAVSVSTACSTGLVAIHLASEAVRNGECDMALAGASSVELMQWHGYTYHEGGILSPDGHCRAFDADAKGTLWGSGGGVVLLKRLSDAIADGDTVHGVLLGSAINNDGSDKMAFSAPSVLGQSAVIRQALGVAGVDPASIQYVEAHGTGTNIGDPIEVRALSAALGEREPQSCWLGSVKPSIGHLAAAAGVAGLIKTVLSLENETIAPTLHYQQPNPAMEIEKTALRVVNRKQEWKRSATPRRAGVSSFGMGGTNAHAIVEEAPITERGAASGRRQVITLSAKTASALDTVSTDLAEALQADPELTLDDVAFTLQEGRRQFPFRRAFVATNAADAIDVLGGWAPRRLRVGRAPHGPTAPETVFLFPGQGSQRVGMARELYQHFDVVRHWIDLGADLLAPAIGFDLRNLLFATDDVDAAAERLRQTSITQPALFVVEYALAKLWESWGVTPKAMIGHSLGEYVACCLAGVFDFADAVRIVAARGALIESAPPGAMISIPLDRDSLELEGTGLDLAAINAPMNCVVSGPLDQVAAFEAAITEEGIPATRLRTSHAFHSAMLEPLRAAMAAVFDGVILQPPALPVISNVTGTWLTAEQATDPQYWADHMCRPVLFAAGLQTALADSSKVLVEVGPGNALSGLARMQLPTNTPDPVPTMPPHVDDEAGAQLEAAARLWTLGVPVDFAPSRVGARHRVPLPAHPFERQRYWIDGDDSATLTSGLTAPEDERPEGRQEIDDWFWQPVWRQTPHPAPADLPEGPWLVLRDPAGHVDGLVAALRERGAQVSTVTMGAQFAAGVDGLIVDPQAPAHFEQLLDALAAAGQSPRQIVHAAAFGLDGHLLDADTARRAITLGYDALVHLAQALAARGDSENLQLTVVTQGTEAVTGGDVRNPAAAVVRGPLLTLPREFPGLQCRHVDLDTPAALAAAVFDTAAGSDEVVAYRHGRRWLPDIAAAQIPESAAEQAPLRERGVYLITGGLGGIGLTVAEELARRVQARLVLVGRSPLPPRDEWERLAGGRGKQARQLATLLRIEALGGEVLAVSGDITDPTAVEGVRAQAVERFGAVHGIVHSAGVAGGTMVEVQSREIAGKVLDPKVFGTLALAQAFTADDLDFFALCSSVTAVLGGLGQVDYCAGNAFLDAFAHAGSDSLPWPVLSINWGAWLEIGMAVETAAPAAPVEPAVNRQPVPHPLLDTVEQADGASGITCTVELSADDDWILAEHRILDTPAVPGTGYLEMARAAFTRGDASRPVELRDVMFLAPLRVPSGERRTVRVSIEDAAGGAWKVESQTDDGWQEHARGFVYDAAAAPRAVTDLDAVRARCSTLREDASLQDSASGLVTFGPRWTSLREAHRGAAEELALLVAGDLVAAELPEYGLHPSVLDEATAFGDFEGASGSYLPLGYGRVTVHHPMPARVYSHLRHRDAGTAELLTCDISLLDASGEIVVEIADFMLRRVVAAELEPPAAHAETDTPPGDEVGIRPAEGAAVFLRVLGAGVGPQLVVTARNLRTLRDLVRRVDTELLAEGDAGAAMSDSATELLSADYVAPSNDMERTLVQLWEEAMGIKGIGVEHDFFELGGNSLVAAALISRVRAMMGVKLPMRTVFQAPTIAGMAAMISASAEAVS